MEHSNLDIACACISLARNLSGLREKWPPLLERVYDITFDNFMHTYFHVKTVFSQKNNSKKSDTVIFKLKETSTSMNKKETLKSIDIKFGNKSAYKDNSGINKNFKLGELSNNKSGDEKTAESHSKEKMSYTKKVIKKKIYSEPKISKETDEKNNDQIYRLKRPLNINLGISRNDNLKEVLKKEETNIIYKNIREKKSLINNYSQIHKKMNVSELVGSTNNNQAINNYYNNSFINKNEKSNHAKSRDTSISAIKQNSFEYKELQKCLKSELSANKYPNSRLDHSSNGLDQKGFNKSSIIEKVEQSTTSNVSNFRRGTCINLNGISILKRLSNKKSLNVEIKNIYKVDANYKKIKKLNISISNMHD